MDNANVFIFVGASVLLAWSLWQTRQELESLRKMKEQLQEKKREKKTDCKDGYNCTYPYYRSPSMTLHPWGWAGWPHAGYWPSWRWNHYWWYW